MADRNVIIHYHLFKNAGSSVDTILQHNFGDAWAEIEGPDRKKLTRNMMKNYIMKNPDKKAISSHTAIISLPKIEGVNIIPIFFYRHPIDRIRSAYDFERVQEEDTPGARVAKEGNFNHYLAWRLASPAMSQISNFHMMRLKDFRGLVKNTQPELFRPRALQALKALPFVGLVERFDESMKEFEKLIHPAFPEFEVISATSNTLSDPTAAIDAKLKAFEQEIGRHTYHNLLQLNSADLELYYFVKNKLWAQT